MAEISANWVSCELNKIINSSLNTMTLVNEKLLEFYYWLYESNQTFVVKADGNHSNVYLLRDTVSIF